MELTIFFCSRVKQTKIHSSIHEGFMGETLSNPGVYHISNGEIRDGDMFGIIQPTDRVVIPAKHEGKTIARTLEYLLRLGFEPDQILVLVNGASQIDGQPDDTAGKAMSVSSDLQVYHQSQLFLDTHVGDSTLMNWLQTKYGIQSRRLHGKGTAMFAACLALHSAGTPDDARIIFLDADIMNSFEVDPVGRLLIGADRFPPTVKMVKLASLGRDNAGIHAFLSTLEGLHAAIGALRWPLCGQVVVRWEDLKQMRLASGYAVEMAMMMDLIARAESPSVFGEVEIGTELIDKRNTDRVHTRMYSQIMLFAGRVHACLCGLPTLPKARMFDLNQCEPLPLWVPVTEHEQGPNQLESRYPDALFPSVAELFA